MIRRHNLCKIFLVPVRVIHSDWNFFAPLYRKIELADERVVVYSKKVRPYTLERFTFYKNADIIIMN